jgi:transcriptional regulator with XRE-family HTH domain
VKLFSGRHAGATVLPVSNSGRELLKELRGRRSQHDVAVAVGVTGSTISQIETGKIDPRQDTVERLDHELSAGGRLIEAFGYQIRRPGADSADTTGLLERIGLLDAEIRKLRSELGELRDEVRGPRRGAGRSTPAPRPSRQ